MQKHFLQSEIWARFQESLGKKVIYFNNHKNLGIIEGKKPFLRIYFPYGPTFNNKYEIESFLTSIKPEAKKLGVSYLRLEPIIEDGLFFLPNQLKRLGLIAFKDVQPQFTMIVDLSSSEEDIISKMNQSTRNLHRNIYKKGISFSETKNSNDIKHLYDMLRVVSKRTGMKPQSKNYLLIQAQILMTAGKARLFFAKDQKGKRIAGALIFTDDDYWYYSHSASLNEARKLQVMPPFLSFIILEAKKAGAKKFDLYGVADPERADHQLASITKFKQSFGGSLVQYSGTWDFPVNSLKYYIYRKIKKIIPKVN